VHYANSSTRLAHESRSPHRRVYESWRGRETEHRHGASKSLTPAGVGKEGGGLDRGGGEGVPSGAGGEERAEAGGVDGEAEEERLAEQVAEAALPTSTARGGDGAEEGDAAGVGGWRPGRQVRQARRDGHDRRRAPRGRLLRGLGGGRGGGGVCGRPTGDGDEEDEERGGGAHGGGA
jgi:hypothetical protein